MDKKRIREIIRAYEYQCTSAVNISVYNLKIDEKGDRATADIVITEDENVSHRYNNCEYDPLSDFIEEWGKLIK